MATFSDQAIGFYLQAEDELTPKLQDASVAYRSFVRDIEKWNKKAFKSASTMFGQLGKLVGAFGQTSRKPITVDLMFSAQSEKVFRKQFGMALADALSRTKFRGQAGMPAKRLGLFDTGASLRTLYKKLPQPPDVMGTLLPPRKFAKGGIVDGEPGVDKVLSLLTKGELVVPAEATKKLLEMAEGPLRGDGGKIVSPKDLGKVFSEVTNLGAALVKMKGGLEAGLGTPKDFANYEKGLKALAKQTDVLNELTNQLSFSTRVRLEPAIGAARLQLKEFTDQGEKAEGRFERLMRKILGPARFLALSTALDKTSESLQNILHSGQDAFGALEEGKTESFVTNMNQTNRVLQLSREGLRDFKREVAQTSRGAGTDLNAMSEAIEGMAQAGMRDKQAMLDLAPAITRMATATNAQVDDLSKVSYRLSGNFKFTDDLIAGTFDNIRMFAADTASDAGKMVTDLAEQLELIGPTLQKSTAEEGQAILSNMARLGASLSNVWAGETDTITGLISRALSGDVEAIQGMGIIFGENVEGMTERLKTGNLEGLLDGLATQINSMEGNAQGLQVLKDVLQFEGTTTQFQNLGTAVDDINAKLVTLGDKQHTLADMATATDDLQEASTQQLTMFGKMSRSLSNLAGIAIPGTTFVVGDLADMLKEVNATTLLSIAYLGPGLLKATAAGAKGIGGLAKGLFSLLGKGGGLLGGLFGGKGGGGGGVAGGLSTIAGAGGKAASAAGTGGFLAGLGTGLTALAGGLTTFGTAMMGPGGLGFLALVAGLFAVAGAARLALPVFEIIGEVAMHAIDGLVSMFETATKADPKVLLALGPGLIGGAAGVIAMAGALVTWGAGAAAAAVGVTALRVAAGLTGGRLEGGIIVGTVQALVGELGPLQGMERDLAGVNRAMELAVTFLGRFGVIGAELVALGAGAFVGSTVTSILGFFGVKSPMQMLAEGSAPMVETISTMIGNFERLGEFGEGRLLAITSTMRDMVGFMADYATLAEQLENMPGVGVLDSIGDSILGFFGTDSPAEKIAAQAGPIAESMRALLSNFERVGGLRQKGVGTNVSEEQLQEAINASVTREADDRIHADLKEQTEVLREMLAVLMQQRQQQEPKPSTRPVQGPRRGGNDFANGIAGFAF